MSGFVFSSPKWISYLNTLNSFWGLMVFYAILYGSLYFLSKFDLLAWGKIHIKQPLQILGILLFTFAFFIPINWESSYVNRVVGYDPAGCPQIHFQAEDGVVVDFVFDYLGFKDLAVVRILAFVIVPMIIAAIGLYFIRGKVSL